MNRGKPITEDSFLFLDGLEQTITEWALDYGITPGIIIARLEKGLNVQQAITRPIFVAKGQILVGCFIDRICGKLQPKPKSTSDRKGSSKGRQPTLFEFEGERRSVDQWAHLTGMKAKTIRNRLDKGWSMEQVISTPVLKYAFKANDNTPGVVSNFPASQGTGAGSTLQETPEITFSETTPRKAIL